MAAAPLPHTAGSTQQATSPRLEPASVHNGVADQPITIEGDDMKAIAWQIGEQVPKILLLMGGDAELHDL